MSIGHISLIAHGGTVSELPIVNCPVRVGLCESAATWAEISCPKVVGAGAIAPEFTGEAKGIITVHNGGNGNFHAKSSVTVGVYNVPIVDGSLYYVPAGVMKIPAVQITSD